MTENMKKFAELVKNDEEVQAELKEKGIKSQEGIIDFAKSYNINLTAEDFKAELSEEELAKVAGGLDWTCLAFLFIAPLTGLTG